MVFRATFLYRVHTYIHAYPHTYICMCLNGVRLSPSWCIRVDYIYVCMFRCARRQLSYCMYLCCLKRYLLTVSYIHICIHTYIYILVVELRCRPHAYIHTYIHTHKYIYACSYFIGFQYSWRSFSRSFVCYFYIGIYSCVYGDNAL